MLYTARVEVSTVQPPTARILWHRPTPTVLGRRVGGRPRVGIDVSMYRCIVGSRFCTGSESNTCSCTFRKYVSKKRGCQDATGPDLHLDRQALPARSPARTPRAPPPPDPAPASSREDISSGVGCARLPRSCFLIWISTCVRLQLSRLEGLGVGLSAVRRSPSPRLGWEPGASVCCCGWRRCPQRHRTRRAC